jgi:hypothetical protein
MLGRASPTTLRAVFHPLPVFITSNKYPVLIIPSSSAINIK